jgi:Protein of unknown function (DUF1553)/Protein of unknown function (DUF1549)/Planctomycete cytochrome C
MRKWWLATAIVTVGFQPVFSAEPARDLQLLGDVLPLFRTRCVKCHGPAKSEAKLNLSTPGNLARGGESGAVIAPRNAENSLLWQRIDADEMPPDDPLGAEEKLLVKRWISAGAKGLPERASGHRSGDHWAFVPLSETPLPRVRNQTRMRTSVDRFILAQLEARGLSLNPEADRATLVRRVSFDLTGLPPTPEEIEAFVNDEAPDAYARMVDRYLASPHFGERWGKYWLDAAGYADSNGYFAADSDRPLAYRYRDYVVRSVNADKPFDRFVVEQLAGDELSGFVAGRDATPRMISLLEATHYLRNGQDGTGESDGNPEELRNDRYAALESCMQIVSSSLLGLTIGCAKCHDHKFEPISQRDFYQLQSVFYPAFNIENWSKPNERFVYATLPGELEAWERQSGQIDSEIAGLRHEFAAWVRDNHPPSTVLFHDEFATGGPALGDAWSNAAPGDDSPGGSPAVGLDSAAVPGALARDGTLQILESGTVGDRWISTKQSFDWTPDQEGEWIQATFDLVDDKAPGGGTPALRIAYFIALVDFDDSGPTAGGNVLLDGNPAGGAAIFLDYPGPDQQSKGQLGTAKYEPGHNYGVRITKLADGKCRLEQLFDGVPDEKTITLESGDLPDGGFGFEYCCARSFVVDNVLVERSVKDDPSRKAGQELIEQLRVRQNELAAAVKALQAKRGGRPGKIAWTTDRSAVAPDVFLLERGNHGTPGEKVEPAPLAALAEEGIGLEVSEPYSEARSTGRRLAWARWLTRAGSRSAALMARVQANRIWQHHFGVGIVATSDNLGVSGAAPSHPDLLEYLAGELVRGGWRTKAIHRLLLNSAVYRQSSDFAPAAFKIDPDNRVLWRMPLVRLDAEALRDAMLATGGRLDRRFGGPYVPTTREKSGEVVVEADTPGANRRSLYLQQRRTQTLSLLGVFDSPSIVFNCVERPVSTMPLQSLSLLNSEFVIEQARHFAARLIGEADNEAPARIERGFLLAAARAPTEAESEASLAFIRTQQAHYAGRKDGELQTWTDFCQMLFASSAFLYVE